MKKENKILLVGTLGYWGRNYFRILKELNFNFICCDLNTFGVDKFKKENPSISIYTDYTKILEKEQIDSVVVVTPPNSHYKIVKYFLEKKKHVLVEKPFTLSIKRAKELYKLSKNRKVKLMVGHLYMYNSVVRKLKSIIKNKELGDIFYIKSTRIGLSPIRKQASALWDLATHDISIFVYLFKEVPKIISVVGKGYIQKNIEDFVNISLEYSNKLVVNTYVSWFAPEKERRMIIVGSKAMAVFDDLNKEEPLKIYPREINKALLDNTFSFIDHQKVVTIEDYYVPEIKKSEPLKDQVLHFLYCIENNKKPLTDGRNGIMVTQLLKRIELELRKKK